MDFLFKKIKKVFALLFKKVADKKSKKTQVNNLTRGAEKIWRAGKRQRGRTWKFLTYNIKQSLLILSSVFLSKRIKCPS